MGAIIAASGLMKEVVLVFPDIDRLAGFIFNNKVSDIGIDDYNLVIGVLLDCHIVIACTKYAAKVVQPCFLQCKEAFSCNWLTYWIQ